MLYLEHLNPTEYDEIEWIGSDTTKDRKDLEKREKMVRCRRMPTSHLVTGSLPIPVRSGFAFRVDGRKHTDAPKLRIGDSTKASSCSVDSGRFWSAKPTAWNAFHTLMSAVDGAASATTRP